MDDYSVSAQSEVSHRSRPVSVLGGGEKGIPSSYDSLKLDLAMTPVERSRPGQIRTLAEEEEGVVEEAAPFRLEMTPEDEGRAGRFREREREKDRDRINYPSATQSSRLSPRGATLSSKAPPSTPVRNEAIAVPSSKVLDFDERSGSEAESVCVDVFRKVDALLSCPLSNPPVSSVSNDAYATASLSCKEYLSILNAIITNQWSRESGSTASSIEDSTMLMRRLGTILECTTRCIRQGLECPLIVPTTDSASASSPTPLSPLSRSMDIGLVSVSLAVTFSILDRKDLCKSISEVHVRVLIEEAVRFLVDPRLAEGEGGEEGVTILKALNAVILKVAYTAGIKPGKCL